MQTNRKIVEENEQLKQELAARDQQLAEHQQQLIEQQAALAQQETKFAAEREQLVAQFRARMEEINAQHADEVEELKAEQKQFILRMFERRSERFIADPNQLKLAFGDVDPEFADQLDDAVDGLITAKDEVEDEAKPKKPKKKRKPGQGKFPSHLVSKVVDVDLDDSEKEGLKHIGYDVYHKLHMKRIDLWVEETRVHKYIDPSKQQPGVLTGPRQTEPGFTKGDHYDASVVATILDYRFGYYLPYYRLQNLFGASGWTPSRSTLENLKSSAAQVMVPFYEYLKTELLQDEVIATDDTGVKLLLPKNIPKPDPADPKSQRTHEVISEAIEQQKKHINAKLWAYRGTRIPLNVFDFTVSRHRDGPDLFLIDSDYQGKLLGDAYGANTGIKIRSGGAIEFAACSAHARRYFKERFDNHKVHGTYFLSSFARLYDIEDRAATMSADEVLKLRQNEAAPIWQQMRVYIDTQTLDLLPKDSMSEAIGYLNNQWNALTRYLDDPQLPIDNNECEQLMKQIAISRKNWLFLGSAQSGHETAMILSVISSAARNDLEVGSYLEDLLRALLAGRTDYESFRPDAWAQANPDKIRKHRLREREVRARRRRETRAHRRLIKSQASTKARSAQ